MTLHSRLLAEKLSEVQAENQRLRAERDEAREELRQWRGEGSKIVKRLSEIHWLRAALRERPELTQDEIRALLGKHGYSITPALRNKLAAALQENKR